MNAVYRYDLHANVADLKLIISKNDIAETKVPGFVGKSAAF